MRRVNVISIFLPPSVSIHASVKDATRNKIIIDYLLQVSIHASVKDATVLLYRLYFCTRGFNPRICKRCDYRLCRGWLSYWSFNPRICKRCDLPSTLIPGFLVVSIHASVKDATYVHAFNDLLSWFQSTHL